MFSVLFVFCVDDVREKSSRSRSIRSSIAAVDDVVFVTFVFPLTHHYCCSLFCWWIVVCSLL